MKKFFVNQVVCGFVAVLLVASIASISSCSASKKTNFGSYPVDYDIAYYKNVNYSYYFSDNLAEELTINDLFGQNAAFTTTFFDMPCTVIIESSSGTTNQFDATLLFSILDKNTGKNVDAARIQVRFEPNNETEKSYLRYLKLVDLIDGDIVEERSRGNANHDEYLLAFFLNFVLRGIIYD